MMISYFSNFIFYKSLAKNYPKDDKRGAAGPYVVFTVIIAAAIFVIGKVLSSYLQVSLRQLVNTCIPNFKAV